MERLMIADIAQHREELLRLCRRFGVRRLAVFGSAAREADFDPARPAATISASGTYWRARSRSMPPDRSGENWRDAAACIKARCAG
jgi:hypothetical protein